MANSLQPRFDSEAEPCRAKSAEPVYRKQTVRIKLVSRTATLISNQIWRLRGLRRVSVTWHTVEEEMADDKDVTEKTIAEDIVVTKYKMAGEIVNSEFS